MDIELIEIIKNAVDANVKHIQAHLCRINSNDHSNIKNFQKGVLKCLKSHPKWQWEKEQPIREGSKVSVDILGDLNGKKCIIEIDTVRHDQISSKFVSRIALSDFKEPIDYVAILYDSTQKSGPQRAKTYIIYMRKIMRQINRKSSIMGVFIHVDKNTGTHNIDIW